MKCVCFADLENAICVSVDPGNPAALQGALPFGPGNPAYNLAAGQQLIAAAAAREQELLYRELLTRAQFGAGDPALVQQVCAPHYLFLPSLFLFC